MALMEKLMRLHKTGHEIADTVSDLIGELPDGDYKACYGILRHREFAIQSYFEIDKGFWGSGHYEGNYRLSYRGTQPLYSPDGPREKHDLTLEPWINQDGYVLICPPTHDVCEFFGINLSVWLFYTVYACNGKRYSVRYKGMSEPINWNSVSRVITFNSTVGIEALRRGIPVISDPDHSTIGSYTKHINAIDHFDRDELFSFCASHQFKLSDKGKISCLIKHYLSA